MMVVKREDADRTKIGGMSPALEYQDLLTWFNMCFGVGLALMCLANGSQLYNHDQFPLCFQSWFKGI